MIVECSNCNSRYKVDDKKVGSGGARIRCKNCGTIIDVAPAATPNAERRQKIIVADDTAFFRMMLTELLTDNGYDVIAAEDGEDALIKVKHELPELDLLLLDMLMPKMDGFTVIKEIKKGAMGKDLPILALSGIFKKEEDREVIKELGVKGFVDKNTPPEEILRRVNMILRPDEVV